MNQKNHVSLNKIQNIRLLMKILITILLSLFLSSTSAASIENGDTIVDGTFTHSGFVKLCSLPDQASKTGCLLIFAHTKQALSFGYLSINMHILKKQEPMFYCMDKAATLTNEQLLEDYIAKTKEITESPLGKQQPMSSILAQYLAAIYPISSC